ncbi:MAG: hypothetical protein M3329_01830, partial [Pseudomonadota bacterium]|nr:hypothetical protein [Pseudomonadota bacterium]
VYVVTGKDWLPGTNSRLGGENLEDDARADCVVDRQQGRCHGIWLQPCIIDSRADIPDWEAYSEISASSQVNAQLVKTSAYASSQPAGLFYSSLSRKYLIN